MAIYSVEPGQTVDLDPDADYPDPDGTGGTWATSPYKKTGKHWKFWAFKHTLADLAHIWHAATPDFRAAWKSNAAALIWGRRNNMVRTGNGWQAFAAMSMQLRWPQLELPAPTTNPDFYPACTATIDHVTANTHRVNGWVRFNHEVPYPHPIYCPIYHIHPWAHGLRARLYKTYCLGIVENDQVIGEDVDFDFALAYPVRPGQTVRFWWHMTTGWSAQDFQPATKVAE